MGRFVLRAGADHTETADVRPQLRAAADWVWTFLAKGIGPGGGLVLVGDDVVRASQALPDVQGSPLLAPYQRLVSQQRRLGDGGALAGLLAAGVVRAGLDQRRVQGVVDGVGLARRQTKALLQALAEPADLETCLSAIDPVLGPLTERLPELERAGVLDLDRIHVRADDVAAPEWSAGVSIEPTVSPHARPGDATVAIVGRCLPPLPQGMTSKDPAAARAAEEERIARARASVRRLGVGLLVCLKDIPQDLAGRLLTDGVALVSDAPRSLVDRLQGLTGAQRAMELHSLAKDDLGQATLERVAGDWSLHGDGPSATMTVPSTGPAKQMALDRAEAWLRCVEPLQREGRLLPGGGAWQRHVAKRLREVADHAPGHGPMGVRIVADVLDRIADAVVTNTGGDATRTPHLDWMDSHPHAEAAVDAALSAAISILRIDAAWRKRSSAPGDLRGGLGKAGSPKGMPGDIPPLM